MLIKGLQKLSLIEYPGKTSAVVFTGGCNFRCPFCHNPELVNKAVYDGMPTLSEQDVLRVLFDRKKWIDGVAITGGEPTLNKDLPEFLAKVKLIGLSVCLETNGSNHGMLERLIREKLVDYVAMDIKASPEKYGYAAGVKDVDVFEIKRSADLLMRSTTDYEFRTTFVPDIHNASDIAKIGKWLDGAKRFVIHGFRPGKTLDPAYGKALQPSREELRKAAGVVAGNFREVIIRD